MSVFYKVIDVIIDFLSATTVWAEEYLIKNDKKVKSSIIRNSNFDVSESEKTDLNLR